MKLPVYKCQDTALWRTEFFDILAYFLNLSLSDI